MSNSANPGETIECSISESFAAWMSQAPGSIVLTTYQAGKVAIIGHDGRQVTLLMRQFDKPMGLALRTPRFEVQGSASAAGQERPRHTEPDQLALASRNEVTVFADAPLLAPDYLEQQRGKYDSLFLPRASYHTGDLNVHDLAWDASGKLWVVNTRFCCLAHTSERFSFEPVWKPPFVSEIVPEDRCHLNGLAMVQGKPKYVTCLGETDEVGGWRPGKATGGCIVDIDSNEVIARGFAMPHSPRWYRDQLFFLNSGAGELCRLDLKTGRPQTICVLPAYLRGLGFAGDFALIGMCQIREKHIFGNLPVQQHFSRLLCGVNVVDLRSGQPVAMLEFTRGCQELFDVSFLPGLRRPMILNLQKDATREAFTAPQFSYWLRPSNELPPR